MDVSLLGADSVERALRTPEWAAEFLGVPVRLVLAAARRGAIPCITLDTCVRFDPVEIKEWVRGRSGSKNGSPDHQLTRQVSALRSEIRTLATANATAISVAEAARRLGCGRTRVFELLRAGRLQRGRSFGRRTLILATSLERITGSTNSNTGDGRGRTIEGQILDLKP